MMTLTLTSEQERRLRAKAHRAQKPIEEVIDDLLTEETPEQSPDIEDNTLALFAQWDKEDTERLATMTPDEIAAEDARDAETLRNIEAGSISLRVPDFSTK